MKSDQRSDHRIKPSIADDVGEESFPRLMVVVTDQEAVWCADLGRASSRLHGQFWGSSVPVNLRTSFRGGSRQFTVIVYWICLYIRSWTAIVPHVINC